MTDEANHIERADIGEANISTLNVGDVQWGKIEELAALTTEIEQLAEQDKELLNTLAAGDSASSASATAASQHGAEKAEIGARLAELAQISAIDAAQGKGEEPKREIEAPKAKKEGPSRARTGSSQLIEVETKAPEITIKAPDISISVDGGARFNGERKSYPAENAKPEKAEKPKKTRKDRTIEIGEPQQQRPVAVTDRAKASPPEQQKSPGFYLGDDGRVRRPDGTFANKVEVRRFKHEAEGGAGQEGDKKHSIPALVVRAFGVLSTLGGKAPSGAGEQAGNVAGVATGGSIFLAVKEMSELAKDTKEAVKERGISSFSDIGPYLKKQLGIKPAASEKLVADEPARRRPKQLRPGELPAGLAHVAGGGDGVQRKSTGVTPKKAVAAETSKSAVASQQDKLSAQQKATADSQQQQSEEQHDEVIKKLGELIDAVKPKGPGLLDSAFDMAGDMWERRGKGGRGGRGKSRRQRTRLSGEGASIRSRGEARGRRSPSRPGRVEPPHRQPKMARVRAGMGKGLAALPAVSTAAGRSAGALVKSGAAMGGAAMGRMAGVGARAIPLVGQAIALGLAAYDGYDGYNDKEGQAKAFDLKKGEEATTGQKSAMAAARVMDLGGLTSGAAGLIGSAAGAMGMKRLEEALTFDSDDMAKAIYEGMTLFTRKNPEKKGREGDTTINNLTSGITPRGITSTTGGWKGTPLKFNGTEAENGLPEGYLAATAAVESGGDPNARNKSGATGMFQFMPKTAAGLGLSMQDALDPAKATSAMIEHTKQNQAYFEKTMGRTPEGRELYLMHQQGMGGGTKLLKNPNALAADVLNSKDVNGMQAVLQNGGRADMTAQEFVDMVLAKYDRAEAYNKANPGKAIDMDKIVGTKPKYEAPVMLRGGPKPGEVAPPLIPPPAGSVTVAPQLGKPDRAQPQQSQKAKKAGGEPPAALMPQQAATAASTSKALPPVALRPVSDIQNITIRNELAEKAKEKKPYAPGANTDAAMLAVLKSMDRSLKDLSKEGQAKTPSGGPARSGGKPSVSGHPTMNGPMASFANDQR